MCYKINNRHNAIRVEAWYKAASDHNCKCKKILIADERKGNFDEGCEW